MMHPDIFLEQEDVPLLVQALNTLALGIDTADARKDMLTNAGIHLTFRSKLTFGTSSQVFANKLVAHFKEYRVSAHEPTYHPLISLLTYLLQVYELEDQERNLFKKLIEQGQDNFNSLTARSAVGRIESPIGTAMGTGVLVDKQYLLACQHIFERIFERGQDQAWVRFGYKTGRYGVETGEIFELDMKDITCSTQPASQVLDYKLVKIIGKPELCVVPLSNSMLSTKQPVRLIHHPRGEPVQISDIGHIVQVDQKFIMHDIETDYGSSGAPIFDQNWRVVALHRGALSLSRPPPPGITEGVPIFSIWNEIKSHLQFCAV